MVKWTYRLWKRKSLQKIRRKTTKIGWFCFAESERERKVKKKLLKKCFEWVKHWILKNLNHKIRLIEKQFRSIEIDRNLQKFLIAISIDRKTNSIDWNCKKKKMNFWKSTEFDATSPQSIEKLWKKKCMNMRWNDFHKPKIWNPILPKFRF